MVANVDGMTSGGLRVQIYQTTQKHERKYKHKHTTAAAIGYTMC
ncbi:MAG TPA: hypothetical protein PLQ44_03745 [Candidatus Paceibacterota bacterium]|nr:hypothetical protein [Candidatus Paceibacterota bacterium]